MRTTRRIGFVLSLVLLIGAGCPKPKPRGPQVEDDRKDVVPFEPTWSIDSFTAGALRVIYRQTPDNPVVAMRLYFDGGCLNLDQETAGIEELLLSVIEMGGSEKYPMDELSDLLDMTGVQIHAAAGHDYSVIATRATIQHFATAWSVLSDLALNPSLGDEAFDIQRARQIRKVKTQMDRPASQISIEAERFFFENHPYSLLQMGTEANLERFTQNDLKNHHAKILNPERMLLVVVGDLDPEMLRKKAQATFGNLDAESESRNGSSAGQATDSFSPSHAKNRVKYVPRDIPTNYLLGYFSVPRPGEEDYAAARVASAIISERLFRELRVRQRLVYGVSSGVSIRRANIGYVYLATQKPNESVAIVLEELKTLAEEEISWEELEEKRAVFITEEMLDLETQSAQSRLLARAYLVANDLLWAEKSLADMRTVTPLDVKTAIRKHFKNIQFVLVGPARVDHKAFGAGEPSAD